MDMVPDTDLVPDMVPDTDMAMKALNRAPIIMVAIIGWN